MNINKLMSNSEIAELLRAIAASYKLKDKDKFKFQIVAYERAADAVEHASSELKDIWDEGKLEEIPGIGKSIADHLDEIFKKGSSTHFDEIMKDYPRQMFDLLVIPGIGPKTALMLTNNLNIGLKNPLKDLEKAAKDGKIALLKGMGENSQREILSGINEVKNRQKRLILPYAEKIADEILEWMKKEKNVLRIDVLGSLRRKVSTVGDIDIAVATNDNEKIINHFINYPKTKRIIEKGNTSASIVIKNNIQVDIKLSNLEEYGSLLQHFTGSKHHNIALREYALKKNFSLNEYGIKNLITKDVIKTGSEKDFYNKLYLEWIPPEIREGSNEIEHSLKKDLPKLVELKEIRGDLQIHSDFDVETSHDLGLSNIKDHVDKANSLGYEYIAFTEHNPSKGSHSNKQIINILKRKKNIIEQYNTSYVKDVKGSILNLFNCLEIDILANGNLPISEKALNLLDFALVSIHSSFNQEKKVMTKRIISALSHPKVKIFAHPTGRRIGFREGVEIDWELVFDYCKNNNKFIEINADPMRLDLPDILVREASKYGIKFTIGTDAHHVDLMDNMKYGVYVARRGWLEKKDVVNTRSLNEFVSMLELKI